jgi:plastocyanin
MKSKYPPVLALVGVVLFASLLLNTMAQDPTATTEAPTEDATLVFEADAGDLQACGAYEDMLHFHTPEPVTAPPSNTPDANAATPTQAPPTSTPRPAPAEDRVGFPENYATDFKLLFIFNRPDRRLLRIICGNAIAAQTQTGADFAYGSVLLMISYSAQIDTDGQLVLDEAGHYIGEKLVALHVQRKEPGFGEAYGADRAGEWEYMAYNADGSVQVAAHNSNFCAVCHGTEAGDLVDFVFRMNLFHEGEAALHAPPRDENEISIYLYSFHDPVLEIPVGTTVTWINDDEATHTVIAAVMNDAGRIIAADEPLFKSDILASVNIKAGDSYSFTFDKPGEYLYRCTIHENMTGKIIVTD